MLIRLIDGPRAGEEHDVSEMMNELRFMEQQRTQSIDRSDSGWAFPAASSRVLREIRYIPTSVPTDWQLHPADRPPAERDGGSMPVGSWVFDEPTPEPRRRRELRSAYGVWAAVQAPAADVANADV